MYGCSSVDVAVAVVLSHSLLYSQNRVTPNNSWYCHTYTQTESDNGT